MKLRQLTLAVSFFTPAASLAKPREAYCKILNAFILHLTVEALCEVG